MNMQNEVQEIAPLYFVMCYNFQNCGIIAKNRTDKVPGSDNRKGDCDSNSLDRLEREGISRQ